MKNLGLLGIALSILAIGCPGPKPTATPDLAKSDVTVDRADGVLADGSDHALVTVTVRDTAGAPMSGVAVQVAASGTGNTLSAAAATNADGVTTVTLASTVAEAKQLTATLAQGAIAKSPKVTFAAGPASATRSMVAISPGTATADGVATVTVTVTAKDANDNLVVGKAVALSASGTQNTLTQPSATDAHGVAVGTLASTRAESKSITAKVDGVALLAQVAQFTPGDAAQLAFLVQPSAAASSSPISPAVQVVVQDAHGNRVTGATNTITVGLGTKPANGTLSGTKTAAAAGGVASFADLSIDKVGAGYTLSASSGALTGAASAPFDITAGAPSKLSFAMQPPASAPAGQALSPAVRVQLEDANGNVLAGATGQVTLSLMGGAAGAALGGSIQVNAVGGVATFAGLTVDKVGTGYTLVATAAGYAGATSNTFSITAGSPSRLAFTVQPGNATAGASLSPAVQVSVLDAGGNTVAGDSRAISLSFGNNPGGGTLSGVLTVNASNGVATFPSLSVDKAGAAYALLATTSGLPSTVSGGFTISAGPASRLAFAVEPSNGASGAALSPAVKVAVQDGFGNTLSTATNQVTLALVNAAGATLTGTTTAAAVAGVATFANLSLDKVGTGYAFTASSGALASATSRSFDIAPGAPAKLVFNVQPPTSASAAAVLSPAVQVTVQDAAGNTVTGGATAVTLSLVNGAGATLSGTSTVAAVSGIASFSTLSVDKVGTGYTLAASATGLTGATSNTFSITPGAAARLAFTVHKVDKVNNTGLRAGDGDDRTAV